MGLEKSQGVIHVQAIQILGELKLIGEILSEEERELCMRACVCACVYVLVTLCVRVCVHALCCVFGFFDDFLMCFVKKRIIWQDRPFLYNCVCMCS